jgi:hypothetical protein
MGLSVPFVLMEYVTMSVVSDIENDINQAKLDKGNAEALNRLYSNKDFILVIGSGYLTNYALELVTSLYQTKTEDGLSEVTKRLLATSYLKGYLEDVVSKGDTAPSRILESESELDSLRAEEMQ